MIMPRINGFPTIILWAVAAVVIVWFIWNKTTFGKNLYAVGGHPEAAAVSGISVFKVTVGAFVMAGILYGPGYGLAVAALAFAEGAPLIDVRRQFLPQRDLSGLIAADGIHLTMSGYRCLFDTLADWVRARL